MRLLFFTNFYEQTFFYSCTIFELFYVDGHQGSKKEISDIYDGKEIPKEFKNKGKIRNLFVPLGRFTLRTEEKYMIEIIKLHISNLRNFSLSELAKINCRFDNPMNYSISILNKYQIGLFGIKNIIENEDLTENEEKINEIYYELIKLI